MSTYDMPDSILEIYKNKEVTMKEKIMEIPNEMESGQKINIINSIMDIR